MVPGTVGYRCFYETRGAGMGTPIPADRAEKYRKYKEIKNKSPDM